METLQPQAIAIASASASSEVTPQHLGEISPQVLGVKSAQHHRIDLPTGGTALTGSPIGTPPHPTVIVVPVEW